MDSIENDCNSCKQPDQTSQPTQTTQTTKPNELPVSSVSPIDIYSFVHLISGSLAFIFLTDNFYYALLYHLLFEAVENFYPQIFDNKKYNYSGDTIANSVFDTIFFMAGFSLTKYFSTN